MDGAICRELNSIVTVQASAEGCVQVQHPARIRDGHLESARSGDDGEGAEVDSALLVRDRGLVLLLGASLGLLLDLDLERAELVVPSKEAVVLRRGGEGGWSCSSTFSSNWAAGRRVRRRAWVLGYKGSSSQRGIWLWGLAEARRSQCTDKGCGR